MSKEKEIVYVRVKSDKELEEKQNKKQKRRITALIIAVVAVIDITFAVIFIANYLKAKQNNTSKPFEVSETTKVEYKNLLEYVNKEAEGIYNPSKEIVSLTFKDGKVNLTTLDETFVYNVVINTSFTSIEESLSAFDESVNLGKYAVDISKENIVYQQVNNENFVDDEKISTGVVSGTGLKSYISFTSMKDDTLYSCSHSEYLESGLYTDVNKTTLKDSESLYGFYYYLLSEK